MLSVQPNEGLDGIRTLRAVTAALERGDGLDERLTAALAVLIPGLADACAIRRAGADELATAPVAAARALEVPLEIRGVAIGSLRLSRAAGRADWTEVDRMIAAESASRLASAIDVEQLTASSIAARLYDDFLATLSHELRTPLNVIVGWVELLRSGRLAPEPQERAFAVVTRNALIQTRLIEDILDASRIINGKLRLEVGTLSAAELVTGAVEAVRPLATTARIGLSATVRADLELRGDPVRLGQVLHNLLGNAIKFSSPGGAVEVTLDRAGDAAVIEVIDQGSGIDPEFLPYVFDRFRQGERRKLGNTRGLGLGLFIVRSIVEMHGGEVAVVSGGAGTGARFTVRLPRSGP